MQILLYSNPSIYCINFLFDFSEINIYSIWGWNLQKQLFLKACACIIFWYWCLDIDGFWILVIWEPPCWKVLPMIGLLSMIGMPSMIGPCRRLLPVHLINFDNFLSDFHASDSGRKRKMRRCVLRSWISVWKMQKHPGDLDAVTLIKMLKWYAQMRMKAFCYSDSMADRLRHFRIYRKEGSHHLKDKMKFMLLASP